MAADLVPLIFKTKTIEWCARQDSNLQLPASRAGASASWATCAGMLLASSARGGIRTPTVLALREAPPAGWATRAVSASGFEPETREGLSLAALPVGVGGRPPSPRLRRDKLAKGWCPRLDSNQHPSVSETDASANWATGALHGDLSAIAELGRTTASLAEVADLCRSGSAVRARARKRAEARLRRWLGSEEGGARAAAAQRSSVFSEAIAEVDVVVRCGPSGSWRL